MNKVPERPRVRNDLLIEILDDEAVIVDSQSGRVHQLNRMASRIWQWLDGSKDHHRLAELVFDEFDVGLDVARNDVDLFLNELLQQGLLE